MMSPISQETRRNKTLRQVKEKRELMEITKIQTNSIQERLELTASNRSKILPSFMETEAIFSYLK